MEKKLFLVFILSLVCSSSSAEWTISLEYSLNEFVNSYPLGSIELRRNYDGNYTGTFKPTQEKEFGKKLLQSQDEVYSVRAKSSTQPGEEFLTTSDPCLILQSNLFHLFWVSINPESEKLKTITVFPDAVALKKDEEGNVKRSSIVGSNCKERTSDVQPEIQDRIGAGTPKGIVTVSGKGVLPSPDTGSFVQKLEREKRAKQHGADADNRGFLAKYWMYIVPVVLFAFISNVVNPENAEAGGGGGGGNAQ